MLKLCQQCEIRSECDRKCIEAVAFEHEDNSKNYIKQPYVKLKTPYVDKRQSGGLSKFT